MACKTLKANLSEYQEFLDEDPKEYLKVKRDVEIVVHQIFSIWRKMASGLTTSLSKCALKFSVDPF